MRGIHGMVIARSALYLMALQAAEPQGDGTKTLTHPHDYPRKESRQVRRARERQEQSASKAKEVSR